MMDVAGLKRGETATGGDFTICQVWFQFQDPSLAEGELLELLRFGDGKVNKIRPYYFDAAPIMAAYEVKK